MIIVHLSYYQGQWLLWGEIPGEKKFTRGRRPKLNRQTPLVSPYDPSEELLQEALVTAGIDVNNNNENNIEKKTMIAWLPTAASRPVASSFVVADNPGAEEEVILHPWKITTMSLAKQDVINLLTACMGRHTLAPGVIIAQDINYWIQVLRFAGSLAAREKFYPGIDRIKGCYYAVWEPFLLGDDLKRLRGLSEVMSGSCWAVVENHNILPEANSLPRLTACLAELLDRIVRINTSAQLPQGFESIHDKWIYALKTEDGLLKDTEVVLSQFAAQIKEWQRTIHVMSGAPFRFCFRVIEPPEEDRDEEKEGKNHNGKELEWTVQYLLQAVDDPSLIIPVQEAWLAEDNSLFREKNFSVPGFVLTALGQVTGLCSHIEESLKTWVPTGYTLTTEEVYEFLLDKVPLLEHAGFIVMVPGWWTKKGSVQTLSLRGQVTSPPMQTKGQLSLDKIVSFSWQVALGEEVLSEEELESLAQMKSNLVKLRGQWMQIDRENIKTLLQEWRKGERSLDAKNVVRLALGADTMPGNLDFEGIEASGWMGELLSQLEGKTPWQEIAPPQRFKGKLRPYQLRGYSWLYFLSRWGMGSCLADDMGLGKTIQTLALVELYREKGEERPVLLVCPTSVLGNWEKEIEKFTPNLPFLVHHGPNRTKDSDDFLEEIQDRTLVITTYSLIQRDFTLLQKVPWAGIILDEAQNIKNANTKQAQATRSLEADYRIALTGTPVENNVGDLWSLMEFINTGMLGNQAQFKREFFNPIQINKNKEAASKLKRLTGPFILRRLKTDKTIIKDLPEKMEMKVFCNLTKEQASLYGAVINEVEEKLNEAEGIERKGLVLSTLLKLKQICNHPGQFLKDDAVIGGRSGKLQRITEMCEEVLAVGEKMLIFTQFVVAGEMLSRYLMENMGREVLFLHGGVRKKERDRMVTAFQSEKGPAIFILSIKAGGTGLNLTQANHVFHFDRWWNPAVEDQATDRAFRIGQQKNVQVYKFVTAGTVEERIDEMIERKKEVAGRIVGTGENLLTELSTEELKEIWALRREAIGE